MFASLDEAVAEGKAKATTLANGELDALHLCWVAEKGSFAIIFGRGKLFCQTLLNF